MPDPLRVLLVDKAWGIGNTFEEHVRFLEGVAASPKALTSINVLGAIKEMAIKEMAEILDEQKLTSEGRWVVLWVFRGVRRQMKAGRRVKTRVMKKKNYIIWLAKRGKEKK